MDLEILEKEINFNNGKLLFSKAVLVFLNIYLFSQFSPTYEKLWATGKISNSVPTMFLGVKYSKYKNNTGDFFESASPVQATDAILQYIKNEKFLGNLYGWNFFVGLIAPIAGTYLELTGENCDFLDILAYWSGYIYSLTSGILIENNLRKSLISKTKELLLAAQSR